MATATTSGRPLTVEEFAEVVGVTIKTVRVWLRRGYLQGVKTHPAPQGHWRIPQTEVDRYLQSQRRA
jgi:excisionase family DNA binding protein